MSRLVASEQSTGTLPLGYLLGCAGRALWWASGGHRAPQRGVTHRVPFSPTTVASMTLERVTLANYRCFAERQDIGLRPVTVVLGQNNSGKSALVRAPTVIETGIRTDGLAPLDLDTLDEEMLESFTDLIHGNRPHGNVNIDLSLDTSAGPLKMQSAIQNISEYRMQVVSHWAVEGFGDPIRLEWDGKNVQGETAGYSLELPDRILTGVTVQFQGLLPQVVSGGEIASEVNRRLEKVTQRIRSSYPRIRYFGPFRDRPQRRHRLPARTPVSVGVTGEHAVGILASDVARGGSQVVQEINEHFHKQLPGWHLDVVEQGGMFSVVLVSQEDASLVVNLADAGTGLAQELPIYVQRALDALTPPIVPVLEIIEQPELHLHPALHASLADLYIAAAQDTAVRFLIETHSETFLLRIRRRVAEGTCDPSKIAIYFVDQQGSTSTVREIQMSDSGRLDYWPDGVFSEDYEEAQALASAQISREAHGAG